MRALHTLGLAAIVTIVAAGCRQTPPPLEHVVITSAEMPPAVTDAKHTARRMGEKRWSGEPLLDVEPPDTLRLVHGADRDGADRTVLYASESLGVVLVDVSNPDVPQIRGRLALQGRPLGVFEVKGAAIVVYEPWDRPATTIVRAFAIEPRIAGRSLGQLAITGTPRDARRIGDFVVVTRETQASDTALESFTIGKAGLVAGGAIELLGHMAVTGASSRGIAIARSAPHTLGPDRTSITWLGLDPELGSLSLQGTVTVSGVIPRWRSSRQVLDVTDADEVRVVMCARDACASDEEAAYATVDFALPAYPRLTSWSLVARAAGAVIGFQATRLVVARPAADRSDATELLFLRPDERLAPAHELRLRGTVGTIVAHESGDVVTVGWTGSAATGKRAIVHHVDARGAPRLVGATSFGGDWTWTRAYEDERSMSFDPLSMLAALPMTTVRNGAGPIAAVQVLSFDPAGPRALAEPPLPLGDRLLFVDGRLLAFSADGVVVIRPRARI